MAFTSVMKMTVNFDPNVAATFDSSLRRQKAAQKRKMEEGGRAATVEKMNAMGPKRGKFLCKAVEHAEEEAKKKINIAKKTEYSVKTDRTPPQPTPYKNNKVILVLSNDDDDDDEGVGEEGEADGEHETDDDDENGRYL
ncbi:hypothetical protein R1sor_010618 [Riccia sorocarpa]|uniref:Uncharacterized protein n=1 Tax=Riccia sorocarpa TaxID=122646 RepID=A0ABD3HYJ8_9MARC